MRRATTTRSNMPDPTKVSSYSSPRARYVSLEERQLVNATDSLKVYVHPTPSAKDNIPGFIALVQQRSNPLSTVASGASASASKDASSYLLAWVPESTLAQDDLSIYVKVDMKDSASPPKQTYLVPPLPITSTYSDSNVGPYAFSFPLSSIYSVLVRPPSLGWWYGSVVINTRSGSSLPALFFHDSECESTILQKKKRVRNFDVFNEGGDLFWGGDEVLQWLKRYVTVERSTAEPSVYLIDPSEEDKIGFGQVRNSAEGRRGSIGQVSKGQPKKPQEKGPGMDPVTKALKETRWKVLEGLSRITTFTRRTAEDIANNKSLPPQVRRLLHNPEVQTIQDEFDSARLYLARWAMGIAEQSERERKQRLWTAKDVLETEETGVGDFELLEMEAGRLTIGESKRKPVDLKEWKSYFDADTGKLNVTVNEVKERIFHGGLDPEDGVRKEAWQFLLGFYDWESTFKERHAFMNSKRDEFIRLKGAWWDRMVDNDPTDPELDEWWREQKGRIGKDYQFIATPAVLLSKHTDLLTDLATKSIEKDVHRTDRHIPLFAGEDIPHPDPTSPFYIPDAPGTNVHLEQLKDMLLTYLEYDKPSTPKHANTLNPSPQNLGYVQGMSDLLAPLYAVFQDDALAFWAFASFMRRMARNFVRDQSGMRDQLSTLDQLSQLLDPQLYLHLQKAESTNFFFFFRMLLVWFKREFDWSDVLRLWESLWTDYYSSQFHLFFAMAILEKHRDVIIDHLRGFDEVLKYINELSGTMELKGLLIRAEALFKRFERTVEAVDKKQNFPAPGEGDVRRRISGAANDPSSTTTAAASTGIAASNTTGPARQPPTSKARSKSPSNTRGRTTQTDARPTSSSSTAGGEDKPQIITPQLRQLLDRKMIELPPLDASNDTSDGKTRASGLKD